MTDSILWGSDDWDSPSAGFERESGASWHKPFIALLQWRGLCDITNIVMTRYSGSRCEMRSLVAQASLAYACDTSGVVSGSGSGWLASTLQSSRLLALAHAEDSAVWCLSFWPVQVTKWSHLFRLRSSGAVKSSKDKAAIFCFDFLAVFVFVFMQGCPVGKISLP